MKFKRFLSSFIDYAIISFIAGYLMYVIDFEDAEIIKTVYVGDEIVTKIDFIEFARFFLFAFAIVAFVCSMFAIKDCVFKNASIGKKFFGLMILDKDFNIPSKKIIAKRGVLIMIRGPHFAMLGIFKKDFFEKWELKKFGTIVIDKKRFETDKENYLVELAAKRDEYNSFDWSRYI